MGGGRTGTNQKNTGKKPELQIVTPSKPLERGKGLSCPVQWGFKNGGQITQCQTACNRNDLELITLDLLQGAIFLSRWGVFLK